MPEDFRRKFPATRVILDATEIPLQKPSDVVLQSATFSTYEGVSKSSCTNAITF